MLIHILSLILQYLSISSFNLASNGPFFDLYLAQANTKGDDTMKNRIYSFFQNVMLFYADFFNHQIYHI